MPAHAPGIPTALLLSACLATACGGHPVEETEFGGGDASSSSSSGTSTGSSETTTSGTSADPDDTSTSSDATTTTTGEATTEDPTTGDPGTLCTRLGGMDEAAGIPALVADLIARVLADDRVNGYFLNTAVDTAALAGCLSDQVGEAASCPGVAYTCLDMQTAHQGLGISQQDFLDFAADLADALAAHQASHHALTDQDIADVAASLGATQAMIVEDPGDDGTVYQRVGRKPAIRALVGDMASPGSFLTAVADDPAINGFFLGAEFPRLATCLTRQIAAIDGPVVYGAEVDAPDGFEPGVAADDPCAAMDVVHAGMLDDTMSPITIDDFMAILADLTAAIDDAAIDPADRDAIVGALTSLCPQIVPDTNDCPGNGETVVVEALDLGLDLVPVDDQYDGTLASMACVDLEVADTGINYIEDVRLTVAMDHTWIGDVTIKVVAPDATLLTALSRVGDPMGPLPDDSSDCCGDDSNFAKTAPFTLRDGAAWPGEEMGKGAMMLNNMVVCADEQPPHDPCEWTTYPGLGPGVAFADFAGLSAVGTWKVCFGDSGSGDFGMVSSVTLTLDKLKDPP